MISRRWTLGGACAAAATLAVTAPAMAEDASFMMNWLWVGPHAPYALADERGFYGDVGIEMDLVEGRGSGTTAQLVANKNRTFGLADTGAVMSGVAEGMDIRIVCALNESDLGVVFLEGAGIESAEDLEGKTLAVTAGDSLHQVWPAIVAANDLDESQIELVFMDPTAKVPALRSGRVDAILGGVADQPVLLRAEGVPATGITFAELGLPMAGLSLIAHADTIEESPDLVQGFVDASREGWRAAMEDPDAAVDALAAGSESSPEALRGQFDAISAFMGPADQVCRIDPQLMATTLNVLKEYRGLETDQPAEAFYTDQFVAG